ncbi:hypothetical protein [Pelotomaculum terephthalicicum]|nr:hypothetical protein [Pelotomaculum terephthalicicum]
MLQAEYNVLPKRKKQYDVIKVNVDKILDVTERVRDPEEDKV